jgi:predicted lactoylglutathione lyase
MILMATKIFVNLPVKDLNKTVEFFTKLGFTFNPQFTDENATCMIVGEDIFVMLLVERFFKTFTKKEICDATKDAEVSKIKFNTFVRFYDNVLQPLRHAISVKLPPNN